MIGQLFPSPSVERRTLLVAGASAGMSATFAAPLVVGVDWRGAVAVRMEAPQRHPGRVRQRHGVLWCGVTFSARVTLPGTPSPGVHRHFRAGGDAWLPGWRAGALSALLTRAVYFAEDLFRKASHSLDVVASYRRPVRRLGRAASSRSALGVGYDTIRRLLQGDGLLGDLCRSAVGEIGYLDDFARLGRMGRRAGAIADDESSSAER